MPVTRTLARQVVRLYRLRMSIEEGFRDMKSHQFGLGLTHRCASVERLQVLVFIASLALLVLWLVGTATIAQGAHYQFQANMRHKRILSVLFVDQDNRIILTPAARPLGQHSVNCLMLSHGQIDFVGITQGQTPFSPINSCFRHPV